VQPLGLWLQPALWLQPTAAHLYGHLCSAQEADAVPGLLQFAGRSIVAALVAVLPLQCAEAEACNLVAAWLAELERAGLILVDRAALLVFVPALCRDASAARSSVNQAVRAARILRDLQGPVADAARDALLSVMRAADVVRRARNPQTVAGDSLLQRFEDELGGRRIVAMAENRDPQLAFSFSPELRIAQGDDDDRSDTGGRVATQGRDAASEPVRPTRADADAGGKGTGVCAARDAAYDWLEDDDGGGIQPGPAGQASDARTRDHGVSAGVSVDLPGAWRAAAAICDKLDGGCATPSGLPVQEEQALARHWVASCGPSGFTGADLALMAHWLAAGALSWHENLLGYLLGQRPQLGACIVQARRWHKDGRGRIAGKAAVPEAFRGRRVTQRMVDEAKGGR
jgi:hypothetical protein